MITYDWNDEIMMNPLNTRNVAKQSLRYGRDLRVVPQPFTNVAALRRSAANRPSPGIGTCSS